MSVEGLFNVLTNTKSPMGFILTIFLFLIVVSGLFSKAAADYGGVFGTISRALRKRQAEAIAADEASDAKRLDRMEATIDRLDKEVSRLQQKDRMHHEYQLYVTGYWRGLQFWAAEKGIILPPPPMMTYPEWKIAHYPDAD